MRSPFRVVCAIDSQMTYALVVLLGSLQRTSTQSFRVTVGFLDDSLPQADRDVVSEAAQALGVTLDFLPLPNNPLFISQGHISPTTFAKFLLADSIPEPHLWIDADTIALPGWDSITESVLQSNESEGLVVAERGTGSGGPSKDLPFNAGVLGWPRGARRDWVAPLSAMDAVETQEQALFNALYAATARYVSEKFNTLTYRLDQLDDDDLPFIIHYAGAHKPWHLSTRLAHYCVEARCPWAVWFQAESALLTELSHQPVSATLRKLSEKARWSGTLRWRRDHSGIWLLRKLAILGPLAPLAVGLLRLLKQWVPRGTHPIHSL